jgi:site-specific recombinase XerD
MARAVPIGGKRLPAFACSLLNKTGDLRLVQAAMNHAGIVSTTIYTTVDRVKLRAAVGTRIVQRNDVEGPY